MVRNPTIKNYKMLPGKQPKYNIWELWFGMVATDLVQGLSGKVATEMYLRRTRILDKVATYLNGSIS